MADAPSTALHPADEFAYIRAELDACVTRQIALTRREEALTAALVADRESRVGALHHAIVSRVRGRDVVDVEKVPDLLRIGLALSGPLFIIDTETTGLDARDGDRLISAAVLPIHPCGAIPGSEPLEVLGNPGRPSSPEALAVHGLTEADLADRPAFSYLQAKALIDIYRQRTVMMHNAPFDTAFLNAECERVGLWLDGVPEFVLDTRIVSKVLWPTASGSLDALADRLGVDHGERDVRHTAMGDAKLLAACLPDLLKEVRRRIGQ